MGDEEDQGEDNLAKRLAALRGPEPSVDGVTEDSLRDRLNALKGPEPSVEGVTAGTLAQRLAKLRGDDKAAAALAGAAATKAGGGKSYLLPPSSREDESEFDAVQALLEKAKDEVDLDGVGDVGVDTEQGEGESVLEYLKGEYDVVRVMQMAKEDDAKRAAAAAVGDIDVGSRAGGGGGEQLDVDVDIDALLAEHESIVGELRSSSGGAGDGVPTSTAKKDTDKIDESTLAEFARVSAMASAAAEAIAASENSGGGGVDLADDYDGLGGGEEGQVMRLLQQFKEEGDLGV